MVAPTRVDKILVNFKTFRSWSGHNPDRGRILTRVALTNFRQVLGLKVFLDLCGGLLMTFPGSYRKPLFISRQLDFGCLGTEERSRETFGVWRFLCTELRGRHIAGKQINRATAVFIQFTLSPSHLAALFLTLKRDRALALPFDCQERAVDKTQC